MVRRFKRDGFGSTGLGQATLYANLPNYFVSNLPAPDNTIRGQMAYTINGQGLRRLAVCDGAQWLFCDGDLAIGRGVFKLGVNLSGAENSSPFWPTQPEIAYFVSRGINAFRLPLNWFGIQPTQGSALSPAYMTQVSQVLAYAAGLGATVLIDIHNSGFGPKTDGSGGLLGQPGMPISALVDLWVKLVTYFKADPNYAAIRGYDLMNEWHDMDPANPGVENSAYVKNLVFQCNQQAITAIRATGDSKTIHVEGLHYSGAWDWVTNNGDWALNIVDPANNLKFHVHCYLDSDSSGTNFVWATEIAKPGYAPPGLAVNVNIGPQRMAAVVAWASANGKSLCLGETGWANDNPANGGNDDYADWNQTADNMLAYCQANNIEYFAWGAGPGFPASYGYNPEPTSIVSPGTKDFTSSGFQSTQMVILEKYSGFAGAQPTAYKADLPYGVIPYAPSGTALSGLKIRYNAKIPAAVTWTGHAALADGTNVGGTFGSITVPAGNNGIAQFSYTPAVAASAIRLTFTNDSGLIDPPAIGMSSVADFFTTFGAVSPNVYSTRLLVKSYIGPAFRLHRASDGAEQDFYFNARGDLPRQAIQDWAGSRAVAIVTWYDQSPSGNHQTYLYGYTPNLVLTDSSGYPYVNYYTRARSYGVSTPSIGQGKMSIYADMNPANSGTLLTQDVFVETFRLNASNFSIQQRFASQNIIGTNTTAGTWSDIVVTYSNVYTTNNLKSYSGGTLYAQQNAPAFTNNAEGNYFFVGDFEFGDLHYLGSARTIVMQYAEYQASDVTALHSDRATYYSTALPDTLAPLAPIITGLSNQTAPVGHSTRPFYGAAVTDPNSPSTLDTVVITLSGGSGTLTGTGLTGSGPYTLTADTQVNITTKLQALSWTPSGAIGTATTFSLVVNSAAGSTASGSEVVTVAALAGPSVSSIVPMQVHKTQAAPMFGPSFVISDPNGPSTTVSAVVTISGSAGTTSPIISNGTYSAHDPSTTLTFSSASPAALTTQIRLFVFNPSVFTVGTVTNFSMTVTNSLGLSTTVTNTITNVAPSAMPTPLTPTSTALALPHHYKGINYTGGEGTNGGAPNPAWAPSSFYDWALSKGLRTIRLPIYNGGIQPVAYGPLDPTFLASVQQQVEYARARGMYIIIDPHSYGGVNVPFFTGYGTTDSFYRPYLNDQRVPIDAFADWWQRVATAFKNYPNVIMGLMNEPGQSQANWALLAQPAIAAIRTVTSTHLVLISAGSGGGSAGFDMTPWSGYTDPVGGPIMFDPHQYFDGSGGVSNTCNGQTAETLLGSTTTQLRNLGFKGVLSEFAYGSDSSCNTIGPHILAYMTANADVWAGWQWWGGGFPTNYPYYLGELTSNSEPRLLTLQANLTDTF